MLFRIDAEGRTADAIASVSFSHLPYHERYDIQEWILHNPQLLGEPLLVVTSEFSAWDRTAERLDVLALSREGQLVVVELKRTAQGSTVELQGLRYAAYCSNLNLKDVVEMRAAFLSKRGTETTTDEVEEEIRRFVELPEFDELDNKPRVILAADGFGPEVTSTVLWLRTFGVDVSCVRLTPYRLGEDLVVDSSVLIPLPEAEDYVIRRERKDAQRPSAGRTPRPTIEEFTEGVPESLRPLFLRMRDQLVREPDVKETVFHGLVSYRMATDNAWITWLSHTRTQARFALPDDHEFPEKMAVKSSDGWTTLSVGGQEGIAEAERLLRDRLDHVRREGGSSVIGGE